MTLHIRHATQSDLDQLYEVSVRTGDGGRDAGPLHANRRLIGQIYVGPYIHYAPELSFVVCDGARVMGFAVAAADTRAYERWAEAQWWPALRARYPDPAGIPEDQRNPDQHRIHSIHHPSLVPDYIVQACPAHAHMNILPQAQGQGAGSRLLDAILAGLKQAGARFVHVGVDPRNAGGLAFWRAKGFADFAAPRGGTAETVWLGRPVAPHQV